MAPAAHLAGDWRGRETMEGLYAAKAIPKTTMRKVDELRLTLGFSNAWPFR